MASQTIFGAIARELRKYNVTLMIVDQRPSGIDSEVMSQLGTRLSCALNDDRDLNAVLMGARDAGQLRGVLARLDSKQQALVFGHAVPMPVVVRPRDYDESFYADMTIAGSPTPAGLAALPGKRRRADAARNRRALPPGVRVYRLSLRAKRGNLVVVRTPPTRSHPNRSYRTRTAILHTNRSSTPTRSS